jgi:hypothetical protein
MSGYDSYASLTLGEGVIIRIGSRWAGFEVELQEILRKPSVYGDGLSFKQFGSRPPDASSDAFRDNNRLFEPYDRIRFEERLRGSGKRRPLQGTITDPTPVGGTFYLVQDPQLLSAGLPAVRSFASRRP